MMSGYDPKRPRPADADDLDGPVPVDGLLDPVAVPGATEVSGTDGPDPVEPIGDVEVAPPSVTVDDGETVDEVDEVDLREPATSPNGRSAAGVRVVPDSQVPVAPAPDGGTANRAVVVAGLVAAAVGVTVVVVVARRRRRA